VIEPIDVYTDGACVPNPGPGGWGALLLVGGTDRELCGGDPTVTTNNRMELTAPIMALESLPTGSTVRLYTDSTYVRDGITKWMLKWKANGWQTAARQPVKNEDLWRLLDTAVRRHTVQWHWVKGHAGHPGNEAADRLAARGMAEALAAPVPAPVVPVREPAVPVPQKMVTVADEPATLF
jgi:ribonuclease HI